MASMLPAARNVRCAIMAYSPFKRKLPRRQWKRPGSVRRPRQRACPYRGVFALRPAAPGRSYYKWYVREPGIQPVSVVIDEPLVRRTVDRIMARDGFAVRHVSPCLHPESAANCELGCCSETAAPDLMVIAVLLERQCSGLEVAHKALRRWPGTKVVFTSTCPLDCWPEAVVQRFASMPHGSYRLLSKPFTPVQLAQAIRELLGQGR
jgi:CheY-like chemotaxis protein